MKADGSITRRLTASVLLLELLAAVVLIVTVANHERHVQFIAFEANLRAGANALLGALQEADARDGSIRLEDQGLVLPSAALYRVVDTHGTLLGSRGSLPALPAGTGVIGTAHVAGREYRFYAEDGVRAIDPGKPNAVFHHVRVVYGLPEGRVWHSIMEDVRFFALATVILLGATTFVISWTIQRLLSPIRELAVEADKIDSSSWLFNAPPSSHELAELRPLASAIEKTVSRLQKSFEQQRRFTSDAAHELKTDLAIAKSSLQLLAMKQRTEGEYQCGIAAGLEDMGRLEATVLRMLTLARLEQTPRESGQHCDLQEALLAAIAQSQPFAEIREIKMAYSGTHEAAAISTTAEDALLLFSNILMNALQHSPAQATVEVCARCDGGSADVRIRDHGAGVSDKDLPFLFDPFYRGDESRSRKSGGTGLGLSICKAICDRSGGTIAIRNHAEGGAEVSILLPINTTSDVRLRST